MVLIFGKCLIDTKVSKVPKYKIIVFSSKAASSTFVRTLTVTRVRFRPTFSNPAVAASGHWSRDNDTILASG